MLHKFLKNSLNTTLALSLSFYAGLSHAETITETKNNSQNNTHKNCYVDEDKDYGLPTGVSFYANPFFCDFSYNYGVITNGKKFGIATTKGKIAVPLNYDFISFIPFPIDWDSNDYQNNNGKIKNPIPKQILVMASLDGKQGYINYANQIVVPIIWDRIDGTADKGFTRVWQSNKTGVIDLNGNTIVPVEYHRIDSLSLAYNHFTVYKNNKYGLYDKQGNQVLPTEYDEIIEVESSIVVKKADEIAVYDKNVKPILPFSDKYKAIKNYLFNDFLVVTTHNDKQGLMNNKGKLIIPAQYSQISNLGFYGNFWIVTKNDKRGVFDKTGKQIIPFSYQTFSDINIWDSNQHDFIPYIEAGLKTNDSMKYHLYNSNGTLVIPSVYTSSLNPHNQTNGVLFNNDIMTLTINGKEQNFNIEEILNK